MWKMGRSADVDEEKEVSKESTIFLSNVGESNSDQKPPHTQLVALNSADVAPHHLLIFVQKPTPQSFSFISHPSQSHAIAIITTTSLVVESTIYIYTNTIHTHTHSLSLSLSVSLPL